MREIKVFQYLHLDGKAGSMLKLSSDTDFCLKTDEVRDLAKKLCVHLVANSPCDLHEFLNQDFVINPDKKVSSLLEEANKQMGESIKIEEFKVMS